MDRSVSFFQRERYKLLLLRLMVSPHTSYHTHPLAYLTSSSLEEKCETGGASTSQQVTVGISLFSTLNS